MRRREFVALVGGAVLAGPPQQRRRSRVGPTVLA